MWLDLQIIIYFWLEKKMDVKVMFTTSWKAEKWQPFGNNLVKLSNILKNICMWGFHNLVYIEETY